MRSGDSGLSELNHAQLRSSDIQEVMWHPFETFEVQLKALTNRIVLPFVKKLHVEPHNFMSTRRSGSLHFVRRILSRFPFKFTAFQCFVSYSILVNIQFSFVGVQILHSVTQLSG